MHISDYMHFGVRGHSNFEFVDSYLLKDNKLFIDPCLIKKSTDPWSIKANQLIESYFDSLYDAFKYRTDDRRILLSHAREQNATKLGYGNGSNGKGKTADGLYSSLKGLTELIQNIPTICTPSDLNVLIQNFGEDNMSDLLTNIIHGLLNEFTLEQLRKLGCTPIGETTFWTWDSVSMSWIEITRPSHFYKGKELLLVPKWIVRKNYLFGVHQYLLTVIIDKIRENEGYEKLTKKDVWDNLARNTPNWEYNYTLQRTLSNPELLTEYHNRIPKHYNRKYGAMSDQELDNFIYAQA